MQEILVDRWNRPFRPKDFFEDKSLRGLTVCDQSRDRRVFRFERIDPNQVRFEKVCLVRGHPITVHEKIQTLRGNPFAVPLDLEVLRAFWEAGISSFPESWQEILGEPMSRLIFPGALLTNGHSRFCVPVLFCAEGETVCYIKMVHQPIASGDIFLTYPRDP